MLMEGFLCLLLSFTVHSVASDDDAVLVSLSSDDVINTFKSVVMSGIVNQLADAFAKKAAERFIAEVKKKRIIALDERPSMQPREFVLNRQRTPSIISDIPEPSTSESQVLNEKEALTLMQEPSPDGDNLESESPYLSEEEIGTPKEKSVPVVGVMKINGMYFRRYLGNLKY